MPVFGYISTLIGHQLDTEPFRPEPAAGCPTLHWTPNMAKTLRDSQLESRTARSKLSARGKPYWRLIEPGLHLGYRKPRGRKGRPAAGGVWVVRYSKPYITKKFATADDYSDPDAVVVLNFAQAQVAARKYMVERATPGHTGPLTVEGCIRRYLQFLEAERKTAKDARLRAEAHIIPQLGNILVSSLNADTLRNWRDALAKSPARIRSKPGEQKYQAIDANDAETVRRRRASTNRILVTLKAALNHAYKDGLIANDNAWRRVKLFKAVDVARVHCLEIAEAKRLINACDAPSGFRNLVHAALTTGCRYSELCRLVVSDYDPDAGLLRIRTSKSAKPRVVYLSGEGVAFFRQQVAGRPAGAIMLPKADGISPWQKSHQLEPMAAALKRSRITKKISFHSLRHTHASLSVMNGMQLMTLATNLGHRDTKMVERHYGHLAPSFVADQVREHVPKFGFKPDRKLASLKS
jgi:integrase